ncbi:MAG: MlaD family protein [Thermodesulfobacteriota bacterium]
MTSNKTKFLVGIFVMIGIFVLVTGMIWLGVNKYFEEGYFVVTYFDESVQGLNIDAPVKYRGVPVGRVDSIGVAPDHRLIEVVMKLKPQYGLQDKTENLVAQLQNIGITGNMFVGLDLRGQTPPESSPEIDFDTHYPVILSKPSDISQIFHKVEQALIRINSFDLETISDKIITSFNNLNTAIRDAEVKKRSRQIERLLASTQDLVQRSEWDRILQSTQSSGEKLNRVLNDVEPTLQAVRSAANKIKILARENRKNLKSILQNLNSTGKSAHNLVDQSEHSVKSLENKINSALDNLNRLTDNLNRLTEDISAQPSRILFSNPPQTRKEKE